MEKILCPTDFSEAANNAVEHAAMLAQMTRADLVLFHVQPMLDLVSRPSIQSTGFGMEKVSELLLEQCRITAAQYNISCYAEIEPTVDTVGKVIGEKAASFDLIVMGSAGPADFFEFLAGSNTYRAAVRAATPVLIIPDGCAFKAFQHVVFAFDYRRRSKLPLDQLTPFLKLFNPKLTVIEVLDEKKSSIENTDAVLRQVPADIILNTETIVSNDTGPALHRYMITHDADMIALCTVERNPVENFFHKSVIKHVIGVATYPVFIFHY